MIFPSTFPTHFYPILTDLSRNAQLFQKTEQIAKISENQNKPKAKN